MRWASVRFVVAAVFLGGCASTQMNYIPRPMEIKEPEIGVVSTAYVGDSILIQGQMTVLPAVRVLEPFYFGLRTVEMPAGVYTKVGEDDRHTYYQPSTHAEIPELSPNSTVSSLAITKSEPHKACLVDTWNNLECNQRVRWEPTTQRTIGGGDFQQTLIYSGQVEDKINVGYREFSNDMARPAFNNDVEYDLGESMVIGYKGARIEVLEATNESIKYRVVQYFQ